MVIKKTVINRFLKATLLCSTLVLLFLVFEIGFRLFSPYPYYGYEMTGPFPIQYDENLGWLAAPNMKRYFTIEEFKSLVETNDNGFRDVPFKKKLRDNTNKTKVMFIGDSFAWGWGVEKEDRLSEQLTNIEPNIVTFNLGQPGYGTDQEFLIFSRFCEEIKPQIVILMLNTTDITETISNISYNTNKPLFVLKEKRLVLTNVPVPFNKERWDWEKKMAMAKDHGPRAGVICDKNSEEHDNLTSYRAKLRRTFKKSHFINWLTLRLKILFRKYKKQGKWAPRISSAITNDKTILFKLLEELKSNCHAIDAEFIVVLIPDKAQVIKSQNKASWQEEVIAFCNEKDIAHLDLVPLFGKKARTYHRLDSHWSAKGHRLAAKAIYEFIKESK